MNLTINYAALAFRPYEELGEYINVGIVAVEGKSRYLAHQLLSPQKTKRIHAAFPELDLEIYREGMRRVNSELAALAIEVNRWTNDGGKTGTNNPAQLDMFHTHGNLDLFRQITRKRTSPFFYTSHGTCLTDDVDEEVERLYQRYVDHWNLTPVDYEEKKLTRDLRKLLRSKNLDRYYREAPWVGTDAYHVRIPLAYSPQGPQTPAKAIKPLNLAQSSPTRIYTHGDVWIAKVNRLKKLRRLPKEFLFVVNMPKGDPEGESAAWEICGQLEKCGVTVARVEDARDILDFALVEEDPDLQLVGE